MSKYKMSIFYSIVVLISIILIISTLICCIGDMLNRKAQYQEKKPTMGIIHIDWGDCRTKKNNPIHYEVLNKRVTLIDIIKAHPKPIIEENKEEVVEEVHENIHKPIKDYQEKEIVEEEGEWLPYLSTSYIGYNKTGNRGELLDGRNAIAMWQSDANYSSYNMHPLFKDFFKTHNGKDYGALPYGTKVEIRIWNQISNLYIYLGTYEVLDDSPTTQYNISDVAINLKGEDEPLYFKYNWADIDYQGTKTRGGEKLGYIPNWKEEYNNKICGWIDVRKAYWGFAVIEIKVIK